MPEADKSKKAIVLINDTTYAYNLRSAVLKELVQNGFEVIVAAKALKHVEKLKLIGCRLIHVDTDRHNCNPLSDLMLYRRYLRVLKKESPDIVLTYNIKPNVYGGSACKRLGIPYIVNVTGLGKPLGKPGLFRRLSGAMYRYGISGAACVFFQNESDRRYFSEHKLLDKKQNVRLLPGSGVDLTHYAFSEYPEGEKTRFLYAARIMREKGIDVYLQAAQKYSGERIVFDICGPCEDKRYLTVLNNCPFAQYHGEQDDMRSYYRQCSCFCLPSYYSEGLSNVLLEAASTGRPIITTRNPGCQEIVEDGVNGYLVSVQDQDEFNTAVERFLALSAEQKKTMGAAARRIAETRFDRKQVVAAYLREIQDALDQNQDPILAEDR